ncbi:hypothetical protein GLOTRDRAFT_133222 [Gloeophyllum trabeum ATCC 11539]|uniref:Uncharacterized protein n=1 Tax=Gloeophyllum trabeum (strain ATCC 11539 / FP-39264 / Madison 617) TaxID=670483 RepID=S7PV28_GLOTA|nr:uncharacterized protein GLOTRDRAFT_133222 [Gloeophyllum trabeum ATCC 11539]EPQ51353.1 hypothetical protein GLOTRDRAFT_133222 [Gloeophyllum trabeum ATCC 11539]
MSAPCEWFGADELYTVTYADASPERPRRASVRFGTNELYAVTYADASPERPRRASVRHRARAGFGADELYTVTYADASPERLHHHVRRHLALEHRRDQRQAARGGELHLRKKEADCLNFSVPLRVIETEFRLKLQRSTALTFPPPLLLMPFCNGRTPSGEPCPCQHFILQKPKKRSNGKVSKKKRCDCTHKESYHALERPGMASPTPTSGNNTIAGIMKKYSGGLERLLLPEQVSEDEARREANTGFHRVPKEDGGAGQRPAQKGKGKAYGRGGETRYKPTKATKVMSRPMSIGRVVLLPCGIKADGEIENDVAPSRGQYESTFQKQGLAADRDGQSVLSFAKEWSSQAIDEWLRRLLPQPFRYLDARHGIPQEGEFHWKLCVKSSRRIVVVERSGEYTGRDLVKVRGGPGKNTDDYIIHFVSIHHIPQSVLRDWDAGVALAEQGLPEVATDEELDVSDNEDLSGLPSSRPRPKPRPAYKGAKWQSGFILRKGKMYMSEADALESSESSSSDGEEMGNSEGDEDKVRGQEIGEKNLKEEGTRKSERLSGKRKRSYAEDSDIEFVEGPSTKKAEVEADNDGFKAGPFDVDETDPGHLPYFNAPLFFTSEELPTASGSGSTSMAGAGVMDSGATTSGGSFWGLKPNLPSPGKPRTSPWPTL